MLFGCDIASRDITLVQLANLAARELRLAARGEADGASTRTPGPSCVYGRYSRVQSYVAQGRLKALGQAVDECCLFPETSRSADGQSTEFGGTLTRGTLGARQMMKIQRYIAIMLALSRRSPCRSST